MQSKNPEHDAEPIRRSRAVISIALDLAILLIALFVSQVALWFFTRHSTLDQIPPTLLQSLQIAGIGAGHVLDGAVPLWNAHAFGGFPFHASGVAGVFYPANFLFAWDNLLMALRIDLMIHAMIAGLGAYVLASNLFQRRIPALLVGVATVCTLPAVKLFAGEPISTVHAFGYFPWLVLCCRRAATTGRLHWGLFAAAVVAVQILTGAFQLVIISIVLAATYVVFEALRRYFAEWEPLGRVLWRTAVALAGIGFGLALAGVQILPSFELFSSSSGPFFSTDAEGPLSGDYSQRIILPSLDDNVALGTPTIEVGGLFLLVLAIFGLIRSPVREKWTIAAVVLGGYLFASGSLTDFYIYPRVFSLPFFSSATAFRDAGIAASLFLVLLAGAGAAAAMEQSGTGLTQVRFIWPLCALLAAAAAWGIWIADWAIPSSRWTVLALMVLGLAALSMRKLRIFAVGAWLIGGFLFDLTAAVEAAAPVPVLRSGSNLYGEGKEFRQIAREHTGTGRMALLPARFDPVDTHLYDGMLSGERTLPLFSSNRGTFMGRAWSDSVERVSSMWRFPDAEFDGTTADREGVLAAIVFLRALNVEYLVGPKPGPAVINRLCELSTDLFLRHELPNSVIYKMVDASPPAYILHDAEVRNRSETFAERIADFDFDWRRTALVERPMELEQGEGLAAGEGILVKKYEDELVEIELTVISPGILVLTDSYYPGWRATFSDGTERAVIRVNEFMRGVEVQPGDTRVVFTYEPTSLAMGRRLSLGAALVWTVLVTILAVAGIIAWRKSKRV